MSSIIESYNYDIFISYRQKDNKGDKWVSEFVEALRTELESTFKEEISVYFDINPHDGLLETHDVDASLKDKLKCLVFIPIISRTYCDPKSFAWEHEFKAFVEQASKDQFGLKVKLPNGNVANRVLPVRIHDLDSTDVKMFEVVIGSIMRTSDFIFKTASGVNRPLRANEDHPSDNINKTYYKDQINKVSLAIKEIITALEQPEQKPEKVSADVFKPRAVPQKSNKTNIIVGVALALALIVLGIFIIPELSKSKKQVEKSIAVLPFKLLSDEPDKQYLADGMMDAILLHLSKIKDLRVMSRTSVEQYRNHIKSTTTIGQELGVEYLLEGSFQKFGDNVRLIIQLIKTGKEGHVWANNYDRNWKDVFLVQSDVAQAVAKELQAVITPEEKQLIEKKPTINLSAYDFYQRGREEHSKYSTNFNTRSPQKAILQNTEYFYRTALKYDSTFAQAYVGLARVYWDKHYSEDYLLENFQDSANILCDVALSFDPKLPEAYTLKGTYYSEIGKPEQAIEEFDKAIELNPNDWMAYRGKGEYYQDIDLINNIQYLQKAMSINHGTEFPALLGRISYAYFCAGFPEKSRYFQLELFKLDGDSASYYGNLAWDELWLADFNKAIEFGLKSYAIDSTNLGTLLWLGQAYSFFGKYREALRFIKKSYEKSISEEFISFNSAHRVGYVYWQNGYKERAEYYLNEQLNYCNRMIELGRKYEQISYAYYDLAAVYAFRGEKDKAYQNLRIFNKKQMMPLWLVNLIKTDPLFSMIRNEPEFQQIVSDVEAKYQAEHERVKKWLEEQGKL